MLGWDVQDCGRLRGHVKELISSQDEMRRTGTSWMFDRSLQLGVRAARALSRYHLQRADVSNTWDDPWTPGR